MIATYMKKFTLDRNPMYASIVVKHSVDTVIVKYMKGFTLAKNPMYVTIAGRLSLITVHFVNIRRYTAVRHYVCEQYGNQYTQLLLNI